MCELGRVYAITIICLYEGPSFISVAVWRFLLSLDDAYHRDRVAVFLFYQRSDPS